MGHPLTRHGVRASSIAWAVAGLYAIGAAVGAAWSSAVTARSALNWILLPVSAVAVYLLARAVSRTLERHVAEIEDERELLQAALRELPCAAWTLAADGTIGSWNPAAAQVFGVTAPEIVGRRFVDVVKLQAPLDGTSGRAAAAASFERGDGSHRTVRIAWSELRDARGRSVGSIWTAEDRTATTETERRTATLLSNLPGMAYRCRNDAQWTMEIVSDGCRELTGHGPDDLLGNREIAFSELIHPDDRAWIHEHVDEAIARLEPYRLVYRIRAADGAEKWVWEQGRVVGTSADGTQILEGFISDITERKNLERQLHFAQRMESLGTLAGGVAHDFNNILMVIYGNTEVVLNELAEDSPLREPVRDIRQAGERAARLTRQLLVFSSRQSIAPQILDVNLVIKDMGTMLRRLIGVDVEISMTLEERLAPVKADPGHMEQVVMNLAVNARDAMPDGGRLTIRTANVHVDRDYVGRRPGMEPGPYTVIQLTDTGCGMDPATLSRIFEPFFTTKPPDKGTGLGLATVFGIVKECQGHIWVYSEPGEGTTFKIYLPAAADCAETAQVPELAEPPPGTETVLLAEDEEPIRAMVTEYLAGKGYTVLPARDGEEALAVAGGYRGPIHVLVSDLTMPRLGGRRLVDMLSRSRPDMRVVFLSGHDLGIRANSTAAAAHPVLQKPVSVRAIAHVLRDILDTPVPVGIGD